MRSRVIWPLVDGPCGGSGTGLLAASSAACSPEPVSDSRPALRKLTGSGVVGSDVPPPKLMLRVRLDCAKTATLSAGDGSLDSCIHDLAAPTVVQLLPQLTADSKLKSLRADRQLTRAACSWASFSSIRLRARSRTSATSLDALHWVQGLGMHAFGHDSFCSSTS